MTEDSDKWIKYVDGLANRSRTANEQNRTKFKYILHFGNCNKVIKMWKIYFNIIGITYLIYVQTYSVYVKVKL